MAGLFSFLNFQLGNVTYSNGVCKVFVAFYQKLGLDRFRRFAVFAFESKTLNQL